MSEVQVSPKTTNHIFLEPSITLSEWQAMFGDILRFECDEDGTYIIGDYRTVVYGDGEVLLGALRDYIISLIEYSELLLKSQPVREKLAVRSFVDRVCKRAEESIERTGRLEGAHYNAMMIELDNEL